MKSRKLLIKMAQGHFSNIRFGDMKQLLEDLGFELSRISGSHHIFTHPAMDEMVNIQNVKGQAKPYQVRQVLQLIERYDLAEDME